MKNKIRFILSAIILLSAISFAFAQNKKEKDYEFCGQNWSWNNGKSFRDLRELSMSAVDTLNVDGKTNGGISVKGENRNDILVRACVQAWSDSEESARKLGESVQIQKGSNVYAESNSGEKNWSVSYQILVPNKTNLNLTANNGGISINDVEGKIEFFTKNGGISLKNLAGDVQGKTTNGGVSVKLSGNSWQGNGLDVMTTNGGVSISMPENYSANIETGTVNGGFKSEIDSLQTEKKSDDDYGWSRNKRISKSINGGGAKVRVVTTNGGIVINKN